eukprot:GFUD01041481.1.p1 GENE.GFUD01041481.1~~GFUD01041481.1.p1  ORF type:complete len:533 (+),score=115.35 GFUD01041481.1:40-1599(+)
MFAKAWHFSLFWLGCLASIDQDSFPPTSELDNLKTCPFPMAEDIEPCSCKVNESYQVFLICNIKQDMDEKLLKKLNKNFACKKSIHVFEVNLNGYSWKTNFSPELLGQFKISYFHLSNASSIVGDIQASAFSGSSFSLREFSIATSQEGNKNGRVESGGFSKLQTLTKVSLGNSFGSLETKSFFDLPNFQKLNIDKETISKIEEEAFDELPSLKVLDFGNQLITSLSAKAFSNLPNLTELNLSTNMLNKIDGNAFYNIPNLVNLDLSKNTELNDIGNMFEHLQHPDLVVNLAETAANFLLKESYKPFIDRVPENDGKGHIDMSQVPLQCACDVKWLVTSNLQWKDVFKNSSCKDGTLLEEVDGALLERMCPPDNCPGYDAGTGRMSLINNDAQCSEAYANRTESWRKVNYNPGGSRSCNGKCDNSGFSGGWHRFLEPAGTKLPIAPPSSYGKGCDVCQTSVSAWVEERRDPEVEEGVIDIQLCFAWDSDPCKWKVSGKAVACQDTDGSLFYLYYLNKTP